MCVHITPQQGRHHLDMSIAFVYQVVMLIVVVVDLGRYNDEVASQSPIPIKVVMKVASSTVVSRPNEKKKMYSIEMKNLIEK